MSYRVPQKNSGNKEFFDDMTVGGSISAASAITAGQHLRSEGDFAVGSSGVLITSLLDEDDLISDSDTALATQQSIKKYIDDAIADLKASFKAGIVPDGVRDGANATFTIPVAQGGAYSPGTLSVYLNGAQLKSENVQENGPGYTSFTLVGGETLPDDAESD